MDYINCKYCGKPLKVAINDTCEDCLFIEGLFKTNLDLAEKIFESVKKSKIFKG